MIRKWIKRKNEKSLILFFNGWSLDEKPFLRLNSENFDICMFSEYGADIDWDMRDVKDYDKVYILAYSLGVAGGYSFPFDLNVEKAVAINGTGQPVDDKYGIPSVVFKGTEKNLSEQNLIKFYKRITSSKQAYQYMLEFIDNANIDRLRRELVWFYDFERKRIHSELFDMAIICTKDRIFPAENQRAWWNEKNCKTVELEDAHFPFHRWASWNEILELEV
ncbi:MAG: hypothetical protein C0594_11350 [Marinilabiliales bacterium]|nr:MAG: hypothetical protein C0594_11350 [Marinilabiliales bacterium]